MKTFSELLNDAARKSNVLKELSPQEQKELKVVLLEEVNKADAGWVSEGNVERIKKALLNIVADRNSYVTKSQHAKELASRYNWDKLAAEFHSKLMVLSNTKIAL